MKAVKGAPFGYNPAYEEDTALSFLLPPITGPFGEFAVTAKDAYCSSSIATLGMRKDDARKEEGECCLGTRDSYRTHKYTTQAQMATTLPDSSEFYDVLTPFGVKLASVHDINGICLTKMDNVQSIS